MSLSANSGGSPKMVTIHPYATIHVYGTIHHFMNTILFMHTVQLPVQSIFMCMTLFTYTITIIIHLPVHLLFMCMSSFTYTVMLHYQGTSSPDLHVNDQGSLGPITCLQI